MKNLDYELAKKLDKEFNMYKKNLSEKSKDEIIKNAYQLVVKEEIKEELKYMDLYDEEKKILICKDNVLDEFYKDWLDNDTPLGEILEESISESISVMTRYLNKRNKEER